MRNILTRFMFHVYSYILFHLFYVFSASFDIADLHIHAWFRVKVNLDKWEDISPADVSVENVIGNVK
jgi:hypothetical protein